MSSRSWRRRLALIACGGFMLQIIPFSCGQPILKLVTPVLLDDTYNPLDFLIRAVAPLVLP
jgi:hypothetical protein